MRVIPPNDGNIPADSHTDFVCRAASLPAAQRNRLTAYPGISPIDCGKSAVDLRQAVNAPAARGIDTLLVEGGSHLLHELFAAGLVTRIVINISRSPVSPWMRQPTLRRTQLALCWRCRAGRSSIGG